jgi:two-component system phosphate regulon sensor histidine kinase PhoR
LNNSWAQEIWRFAGIITLAAVIGLLFGIVPWSLLLAVLVYLGWHLKNLYLMRQWLQGRRGGFPDVSGVWEDIFNQLYRLQKRNRRRKKKLAAMVKSFRESTDAMPDAAIVLDSSLVIESWNKSAASLLGLRHPYDNGQPITNLIRHPDFIRFIMREDFSENLQMVSPQNESVMLSLRIVPYGNKQKLLLVRDITRIHMLEQMRQDFIANVSHELRTPLTVISGYLETLIDDDDESLEAYKGLMGSMQSQTHRMQNIVSDLLLLSRLETDKSEHLGQPVDVPALIEMIREDALALSSGKHSITVEADRDLWLRGNRDELLSAFSNLVYNAVQYTPENGAIRIEWSTDNTGAHFSVTDTGDGIPAQHIPRLTERFYRVDVGRSRDKGGTGLGLAIVKHVLNHHKGYLYITSELGKGSTFRCNFPKVRVVQREVA